MILLLVWAVVGFLLGICMIIVVPWTGARIAGAAYVEAVSDKYVWFAQTAARRSALVVRDGDVKLVPKRYDSDLKADKDSATGDDRHHKDDFDVLGRLKNKVFGFALTSRDAYVSPLVAELGEIAMREKERKEIGREEVDGTADKFVDGIHVPERPQLVDLSAARHLTTGACEPEKGRESYEKAKISQEKFHERVSFGQGMLIILAALGSMGLAWFVATRGAGSEAAETVSNQTTVGLLWLLLTPLGLTRQQQLALAGAGGLGSAVVAGVVASPLLGLALGLVVTGGTLIVVGLDRRDGDGDDRGGLLDDVAGWGADISVADSTVRKVAAGAWVLGWLSVVPMLAAIFGGPVIAVVVTGLMVLTPVLFLGGIALFGPSFPVFLGMALARGFWILAQLTVGRGVFVERDSGEIEHRQLRVADSDVDADYVTALSTGETLHIDGSKGDLIRFAWAPIGAAAEKTAENMANLTEDIPAEAATDGGTVLPNNKRQGFQPELRVGQSDEWVVTLPQLWSFAKNTSESDAVRQGRQKALTEHGGEQQISMVVFFAMILAAILLGGVFGLIAGGAIL